MVAVARTLALDRVAVEAVGALRAEGIEPLLVKGPALARLLYDQGELRPYGDVDLLVGPGHFERALAILQGRGFEGYGGADPEVLRAQGISHAAPLTRRSDGSSIDLHRTLLGVRATADRVFATFSENAETVRIGGSEVPVPRTAVLAFHVALHAAQHGAKVERPLEDLRRALERFDQQVWAEATLVAAALDAIDAFAAGLRLLPAGGALAERLGVGLTRSVEAALRAHTPPSTSLGWERLMRARGVRGRLGLLRRAVAPSPSYLRIWATQSGYTASNPAALYPLRAAWLVTQAPGALRAVREARAEAGATRPPLRASARAAWWATDAVRTARRQLHAGGLGALDLAPPPPLPAAAERGVATVLDRSRSTCLVRAAVRQAWEVAHGERRDIVVGVARPDGGFRAHAWLDGDPESESAEFVEITRHEP